MKLGAIITGDIVNSQGMDKEERNKMLDILQTIPEKLYKISNLNIEIFRGDSFQIEVLNIYKCLQVAVALRTIFRSQQFKHSSKQWDVRLSIGIGKKEYEKETLAASDGEAYRLSGIGLDNIGKERLKITTPWEIYNKSLVTSTAFADDIISNLTQRQSEILSVFLTTSLSRKEISKMLDVSRQAIEKSLKSAKANLINLYIKSFEEIISLKLKSE